MENRKTMLGIRDLTYFTRTITVWLNLVEIIGLHLFQFMNVVTCTHLDFMFASPEIDIFGKVLVVDSHLDSLSILLQSAEDIGINITSVVNEPLVLVFLFNLPIA